MGYHVGVRVIVNDGELSSWQLARCPPLETCSVGWKLLRWSRHPNPSLSGFRPVVPLTLNFQEWLQQVFNDLLVSESDIIVNANKVASFCLSHTFVSGFPVGLYADGHDDLKILNRLPLQITQQLFHIPAAIPVKRRDDD
jgi:hypothetical protein